GQPLFVAETDKATVEVESFRDGFVRALLVEAGARVPVGAVVALLADLVDEPERIPSAVDNRSQSAAGPTNPDHPGAGPRLAEETRQRSRILVSPVARRMAEMEGIDLAAVIGSGRQGQILKRDVERALAQVGGFRPVGVRREPVTAMRRAIAQRTRRSKLEAPHFYAAITIDMAAALDLRREAVEYAKQKGWAAPSITDLCLRATALVLVDYPALNASFQEDEIVTYRSINVGFVVGRPEGMVIPVVHKADRLNLYTLATITRRLRQRAERGTLSSSELSDGTFTLSNLGMYGLDSFAAVINPPQAGIIALGAVQQQPAVRQGAVVSRPLMQAVLSVDHRLVDGTVAAQFLASWKALLENPFRLALEPPEETV
ncbi:MAG: dihydrolipoamide acetyltransferase family protein, partial [Candidatus Promineifilaceae bacterium]